MCKIKMYFCIALNISSRDFNIHCTFRSSHQRCSVKKGVPRNFENSKENTCARVSFSTLLKKRLWHRRFPVNFAKFRRTPFSQSTSGRLLLQIIFVLDKGNNSVNFKSYWSICLILRNVNTINNMYYTERETCWN